MVTFFSRPDVAVRLALMRIEPGNPPLKERGAHRSRQGFRQVDELAFRGWLAVHSTNGGVAFTAHGLKPGDRAVQPLASFARRF